MPLLVNGLPNVVAIAAGSNHNLAVTAEGQVWAWGANTSYQLGDGTTTNRLTPVAIGGLSDVVHVEAGAFHSLARTRSGALWVWGEGGSGQLGLGSQTLLDDFGSTITSLWRGETTTIPDATSGLDAAHDEPIARISRDTTMASVPPTPR